jgi:3-hydroxyisobutyrate dehydrogenase-like beta-hydroxyacid dehydrogenase
MPSHFAFIGVGRMGGPMAGRLLDRGHRLTVFDVSERAMAPLLARGAARAASPRAAASADDVAAVFTSLPTPDIVEGVALGPDGVIEGKAQTFIDLSTTGPRVTGKIAAALTGRGIAMIDAPVSGGVAGAQKGTLAVMAACPRPLFERFADDLGTFGTVFHVGERPGLGQVMKLANNLLSATAMAVSSEAIVMGVKAGLDPKTMLDVINAGSGRNTATQDKFPRSVLPRRFDFGFTAGLMLKDVKLCLDEAEAQGVPMWVGNAVKQLWLYASQRLGPDADITEIVKCIEDWAGVEVGGNAPR